MFSPVQINRHFNFWWALHWCWELAQQRYLLQLRSWAYSYRAFILSSNMGAKMHFPGQDWCLTYWPKGGLETMSAACTMCEMMSPSKLLWSLHSRQQNHKGILLASWGRYFFSYHGPILLGCQGHSFWTSSLPSRISTTLLSLVASFSCLWASLISLSQKMTFY